VRGQRHAPAAPYPRERPGTHFKEGWVGLRAGMDRCGKSRSPDLPARRQSQYRLRYPAHLTLQLTANLSDFVYRFLAGTPLLGDPKKFSAGERTRCRWP